MSNDTPTATIINCPQCQKPTAWHESNKHRPFCSKRCQILDLGAWASEDRKIAGREGYDMLNSDTDDDLS